MSVGTRIVAKPELCRDCQICALACSLWHEGRCGPVLARLAVVKDMAAYTFDIRVCQQCATPACLAACPGDAMYRDARGVVIIRDAECTRCGACAEACPFDAILGGAEIDRYLKCDLCAGRDEGPLCVALCPVGALAMGQAVEGEG